MARPRQIDRFLFRGYAVGFGGLIWEPRGVEFPAEASVCIPLTGGRAGQISKGIQILEPGVSANRSRFEISFGSAKSTADGNYDDAHRTKRTKTTTTVTTRIETVKIVSGGHTVEIDSVSLGMKSEHNLKRGEQTKIEVLKNEGEDPINGLRIDNQQIGIDYADEIMDKHTTYDELKKAYEHDEKFLEKHKGLFKHPPGHPFPASDGIVLCTIVSGVTGLPAGVEVGDSPNEIVIPGFGLIALGEMFIYTHERRLTAVRLALDSPPEGDTTLGGVGTDGNNWPP